MNLPRTSTCSLTQNALSISSPFRTDNKTILLIEFIENIIESKEAYKIMLLNNSALQGGEPTKMVIGFSQRIKISKPKEFRTLVRKLNRSNLLSGIIIIFILNKYLCHSLKY